MTRDFLPAPPASDPDGDLTSAAAGGSPTERLAAIEVEYRARLLAWATSLAADVAADAEGASHLCPPGDPHCPPPA